MSASLASGRTPRRPVSIKLRARMEAAVEHLLALLDALDGDPDEEPILGSPEIGLTRNFQTPDGAWHQMPMTQERWVAGGFDDRELDIDSEEDDTLGHGECDDSDREPSLGWPERGEAAQAVNVGGSDDREREGHVRRPPKPRTTDAIANLTTTTHPAYGNKPVVIGPDGYQIRSEL